MEPLRPGECLQPLLLIPRRSEERSSSGPGGSGEFFSIPDDRGLPILTNSDQYLRVFKAPGSAVSLSPDFYSKRRASERICPGFAFNSRQTDWQKKPEFQWRQARCVMGRTFIGAQLG